MPINSESQAVLPGEIFLLEVQEERGMADNPGQEHRKFVRINLSLRVKYRFISTGPDFAEERVYEGQTNNIGGGGLLLTGQVPSVDWITELLMEKVLLALTVDLPEGPPVQAIARVAWLEAIDQNTEVCQLGLTFKEITGENRDRILDFVITAHAPAESD
ncbi:MAG: PilZ domain-containing protein [Planctomycetes bacterium]|nr:PilZ domain-containing protein [Planctomycetota bacterium]